MSTLSGMRDELRETAEKLREHGTFVCFGGTTSTDPLMLEAAELMNQAADAIRELQEAVDESNGCIFDYVYVCPVKAIAFKLGVTDNAE